MVGHQKAKMGPLARVNPYYKNYKGRVNAFFSQWFVYMCSATTLMSFFRFVPVLSIERELVITQDSG